MLWYPYDLGFHPTIEKKKNTISQSFNTIKEEKYTFLSSVSSDSFKISQKLTISILRRLRPISKILTRHKGVKSVPEWRSRRMEKTLYERFDFFFFLSRSPENESLVVLLQNLSLPTRLLSLIFEPVFKLAPLLSKPVLGSHTGWNRYSATRNWHVEVDWDVVNSCTWWVLCLVKKKSVLVKENWLN